MPEEQLKRKYIKKTPDVNNILEDIKKPKKKYTKKTSDVNISNYLDPVEPLINDIQNIHISEDNNIIDITQFKKPSIDLSNLNLVLYVTLYLTETDKYNLSKKKIIQAGMCLTKLDIPPPYWKISSVNMTVDNNIVNIPIYFLNDEINKTNIKELWSISLFILKESYDLSTDNNNAKNNMLKCIIETLENEKKHPKTFYYLNTEFKTNLYSIFTVS